MTVSKPYKDKKGETKYLNWEFDVDGDWEKIIDTMSKMLLELAFAFEMKEGKGHSGVHYIIDEYAT